MEIDKIRKEFPFLERRVKGKPIIYFDNGASSQKPRSVIDGISDMYANHYANIHRGVHKLSQEASEMYEGAHKKVGKFLGASKPAEEIIFTKNATEGLNIIANGIEWNEGDEVIVSEMEHHANIVPWQMLKEKGVVLKFAPVKFDGTIDIEALERMTSEKTKIISIVHASNFLGTVNPVEKIRKIANKAGALFSIDGAQSAPHMPINVSNLKCDFFTCAGHKMCGPTGTGILYGRKKLLEELKPLNGGGDMISKVSFKGFEYNTLPWKFEAGTPNIAEGYGMGLAVDFLKKIGMKNIFKHDKELVSYVYEEMKKIDRIEIYGPEADKRNGVISFNVTGMKPHDVAGILNERENIAVRSGFHCVEPMHRKMDLNYGSARASFYLYNNHEEAGIFLKELKKIVQVFK